MRRRTKVQRGASTKRSDRVTRWTIHLLRSPVKRAASSVSIDTGNGCLRPTSRERCGWSVSPAILAAGRYRPENVPTTGGPFAFSPAITSRSSKRHGQPVRRQCRGAGTHGVEGNLDGRRRNLPAPTGAHAGSFSKITRRVFESVSQEVRPYSGARSLLQAALG